MQLTPVHCVFHFSVDLERKAFIRKKIAILPKKAHAKGKLILLRPDGAAMALVHDVKLCSYFYGIFGFVGLTCVTQHENGDRPFLGTQGVRVMNQTTPPPQLRIPL